MSEYFDCSCGKQYTKKNKKQHERSVFHKENTQGTDEVVPHSKDMQESEIMESEISDAIHSGKNTNEIDGLMRKYLAHSKKTGCGDKSVLSFIQAVILASEMSARCEIDTNIERKVGNEKHLIATGTLVKIKGDDKTLYKVVRERKGLHSLKDFRTGKPIRSQQYLGTDLIRC